MISPDRVENDVFAARFVPHISFLYRFGWRLTHSREQAEDLVHQLAVNLLVKEEDLAAKDNLKTWLGRCLYRLFVSEYRKITHLRLVTDDSEQVPESIEDPGQTPSAQAEAASVSGQVQRAMMRLSREHREVLLMHDAEETPLPQLAQMLDVPLGTLKSRLHRARLALRELIEI